MSESADKRTRDLLEDLTLRLQKGEAAEPALARAEAAGGEVADLADLVRALHESLKPQSPRPEFADSLRADLLAAEPGVVHRIRQMPPRVHLAAFLALIAGCVLLMLRRVFGSETAQDLPEEAVATPL